MRLFLLLAVIALAFADESASDHDREKATLNSKKILFDLYTILRNIAFPDSPLSSGAISNRFILLSPGKVLNFWDYYPGVEYEQSLLRQNLSAIKSVISPSVMEKWFDVADSVIGANSISGGITGKSMANVYETIISQMELLGIKSKSNDAQSRYNEGRNYLTSILADPENPAINSTRLTLYKRYQDLYVQRQLEMEQKIEETRQSRSSLDYELWFQRNYPSLSMRVEGAYTQWLVFGEKERVELYKAYMDVASSGSEVEKAKMSLRASGVTSLDRTRTIYPVSFEPGNWYKYLLPKIKGPSRDMVLAKKSLVEAEISTLKTMISFSNVTKEETEGTLRQLNDTVAVASLEQQNKTKEAIRAKYECLKANTTQGPACLKLRAATEEAVDSTFTKAQASAQYQSIAFTLNSDKKFNSFLSARISSLQQELSELERELSHSEPYLGPIADSRDFQNLNNLLNETEQNLDDNWLQFEYDSDSSHVKTSQESNSVNFVTRISAGYPLGLSFGLGVNAGKSNTDLNQAISSANVKVSGELLRVSVKRPWFKPSIFEDSTLSFVQFSEDEQKATYVSPGPKDEVQFQEYVAGQKNNLYLMPEYITGFVLARGIKLQFSGVDAKSASHLTQLMVGVSFSASYQMFTLAGSVGVNKMKQSVTADRTANGMIINIPGAQIIGYYTAVLPKFPYKQT